SRDMNAFPSRRSADLQDGIILGATAENLNDALDFVFAPYERIQRALGSRLREVAAEFREERSFLWPRCRCFFAGRARELFPQRRSEEHTSELQSRVDL